MPLIVEDGTGKTDSESYCSVEDADKYFADRGIEEWEDLDITQKEQALRKATDYIELRFGSRFTGCKNSETQSLSFPRYGKEEVPRNLIRACAEYALRASKAALVTDPEKTATGLPVKSKVEKLGPMEERTEYDTLRGVVFNAFPAADTLLKSLLSPRQIIR